jgi:hypothetical protein
MVVRNDHILLMFNGYMSAKSDPDKLTELKNTVKIYEDELLSSITKTSNLISEGVNRPDFDEFIKEFIRSKTRDDEFVRKILSAYREYVKELERYTLR